MFINQSSYIHVFNRFQPPFKSDVQKNYQKRRYHTNFKVWELFNFTFRYIDDFLSLNNSKFGDFVDHIYPIELEIKDNTEADMLASCLYLQLKINRDGRLRTQLYYKEDDFNFFHWHCELYNYILFLSSTRIWRIFIAVKAIFSVSSSFRDFPDRGYF